MECTEREGDKIPGDLWYGPRGSSDGPMGPWVKVTFHCKKLGISQLYMKTKVGGVNGKLVRHQTAVEVHSTHVDSSQSDPTRKSNIYVHYVRTSATLSSARRLPYNPDQKANRYKKNVFQIFSDVKIDLRNGQSGLEYP